MAVLLVLHALAWLTLLALWLPTPPVDNVEQLVWMRGLEWGYYKHPPWPTWVAIAVGHLTGPSPAVLAALGASCVMGSLLISWHLWRHWLGQGRAWIAVLAALCLTYSTQRLDYYNHNVVMMPLIAGVIVLLWRTTIRPSRIAWMAIGLLLGLGMLTKYQMAVVALCVSLWWLRLCGWRDPVQRSGFVGAVVIAAVVFAPHVLWLLHSEAGPLRYARESSLDANIAWTARPAHVLLWMLDWMLNRLLPAWLLLGAAVALAWRRRVSAISQSTVSHMVSAQVREYVWLWGFGPMILMALLGVLTGIHLQMKWSTAFVVWTVPAAILILPQRWQPGDLGASRGIWLSFGLIQLLLAVLLVRDALHKAPSEHRSGEWRTRNFAAAAAQVDQVARERLGGAVEVIHGPYGVAGALAEHLPGRPLVLIDGDLGKSPWLSPEHLASARTISVWPTCQLPEDAVALMAGWGWWPRSVPPVLQPSSSPDEVVMRRAAIRTGGTENTICRP